MPLCPNWEHVNNNQHENRKLRNMSQCFSGKRRRNTNTQDDASDQKQGAKRSVGRQTCGVRVLPMCTQLLICLPGKGPPVSKGAYELGVGRNFAKEPLALQTSPCNFGPLSSLLWGRHSFRDTSGPEVDNGLEYAKNALQEPANFNATGTPSSGSFLSKHVQCQIFNSFSYISHFTCGFCRRRHVQDKCAR